MAKRSKAKIAGPRRFEDAASVAGLAMPTEELIPRIRSYSWKESFIRLADLAGVVANAGADSEAVRSRTIDPLLQLTGSSAGLIAKIKEFVRTNRNSMVIAHEEAINYLQHLVLLEGGEEGDGPADTEIGLWLLGINDHVSDWLEEDERALTEEEELIAVCAHALRFNNSPDLMREVARTFHLLEHEPLRGVLADDKLWRELQQYAFGCEFRRYFSCFAYLLALLSLGWGTTRPDGLPILEAERLYGKTEVEVAEGAAWLSRIAMSRDEAKAEIGKRVRDDGLPHAPTALLRTPLVQISEGRYIAASPWVVRAFLKTGLWARMLFAAKDKHKKGADIWLSTFGDKFEQWCRDVADDAAKQRWFKGELLLPSEPGADDEIEDVVLCEGRAAIFFSAKGRLVPEPEARHAKSRSALIDWYEKYFFGAKSAKYRAGVIRQLDARITLLRNGEFEPDLNRSTRVLPVILTYDSLCEDVLLYRWLEERCVSHGCLQQPGVAPLTLAKVDDFEDLMMRAAEGESAVGILRKRESSWKHQRLDRLLFSLKGRTRGGSPKRLPMIEEVFETVVAAQNELLFGKAPDGTPIA